MATIDIPVLSGSMQSGQNEPFSFFLAPKDSNGAGIDLHTAGLSASAVKTDEPLGLASANAVTMSPAVVSGAAGKLVVSDTAPTKPGSYLYELVVTPSGGTAQMLALMSFTVK